MTQMSEQERAIIARELEMSSHRRRGAAHYVVLGIFVATSVFMGGLQSAHWWPGVYLFLVVDMALGWVCAIGYNNLTVRLITQSPREFWQLRSRSSKGRLLRSVDPYTWHTTLPHGVPVIVLFWVGLFRASSDAWRAGPAYACIVLLIIISAEFFDGEIWARQGRCRATANVDWDPLTLMHEQGYSWHPFLGWRRPRGQRHELGRGSPHGGEQ